MKNSKPVLVIIALLALFCFAAGKTPASAEQRGNEQPPEQQVPDTKNKDQKGAAESVFDAVDQSTRPAPGVFNLRQRAEQQALEEEQSQTQPAPPYQQVPPEVQKNQRDQNMKEMQRRVREDKNRSIEDRNWRANKQRGIDRKSGPGDIADEPGKYSKPPTRFQEWVKRNFTKDELKKQLDPEGHTGKLKILDTAAKIQQLIDCKRSGKTAKQCAKEMGLNWATAKSVGQLLNLVSPALASAATVGSLAVADYKAVKSIMELHQIRKAMKEDRKQREKQERDNFESDRLTWPGTMNSLQTRLDTLQQQFDSKLDPADQELKAACGELFGVHQALAGKVSAAQAAVNGAVNSGITQEAVDTTCPSAVQGQLDQLQSRMDTCQSTISSAAVGVKALAVKCLSAGSAQRRQEIAAKIAELQGISKTLAGSLQADLAKAQSIVQDANGKVNAIKASAQTSLNVCNAKFRPLAAEATAAVAELRAALTALRLSVRRVQSASKAYESLKKEYLNRLQNLSLSIRKQLENSTNDRLIKEVNAKLDSMRQYISTKKPTLACGDTLQAANTDLKIYSGNPAAMDAKIKAANPCKTIPVNCPTFAVPVGMAGQAAQAKSDLAEVMSVKAACEPSGQGGSGDQSAQNQNPRSNNLGNILSLYDQREQERQNYQQTRNYSDSYSQDYLNKDRMNNIRQGLQQSNEWIRNAQKPPDKDDGGDGDKQGDDTKKPDGDGDKQGDDSDGGGDGGKTPPGGDSKTPDQGSTDKNPSDGAKPPSDEQKPPAGGGGSGSKPPASTAATSWYLLKCSTTYQDEYQRNCDRGWYTQQKLNKDRSKLSQELNSYARSLGQSKPNSKWRNYKVRVDAIKEQATRFTSIPKGWLKCTGGSGSGGGGSSASKTKWYVWYVDNINVKPMAVGTEARFRSRELRSSYSGGGLSKTIIAKKVAVVTNGTSKQDAINKACRQISKKYGTAWGCMGERGKSRHIISGLNCCR
jgi:hypothetical protein